MIATLRAQIAQSGISRELLIKSCLSMQIPPTQKAMLFLALNSISDSQLRQIETVVPLILDRVEAKDKTWITEILIKLGAPQAIINQVLAYVDNIE